jgi:hypothetical protein
VLCSARIRFLTLVAAALAGCSTSGHDAATDDGAGSGGAAAPIQGGSGGATGTGGAGTGTGGRSAAQGMGTGGMLATGSGGVGGGAGGAPANGSGGMPAMHMDAGAITDAAADAGPLVDAGTGGRGADPPFSTVYRIALRVHRGDSDLSDDDLLAVLDEMNWIWWSQAAICFEIEIVSDDQTMQSGFDFWFHKDQIPCSPGANGVYCSSDHDIHSLDRPNLSPADDPAWNVVHGPSRTSAHELGHGLTLQHYDGNPDSNDSLMSSGHQGFKLHDFEITAARMRADEKKLDDTGAIHCAVPTL